MILAAEPRREEAAPTGRALFPVALASVLATWLVMGLQELLLFFRPTPYGTPYVVQWWQFLPQAIVWNLTAPDHPVSAATARRAHRVLLGLLIFCVFIDQIDNELMRYIGLHLSWSLLRTYYDFAAWGTEMLLLFAGDKGGPGLPFLEADHVWPKREVEALR